MDNNSLRNNEQEEEEEEMDEEEQNWDDWNGEDDDELECCDDMVCLFCDLKYSSSDALFRHCCSSHHFDFRSIRTTLGLDFYASFKLINYVRSQVAQNRCWSCGLICQSKQDLRSHLHEIISFHENSFPWGDDKYLNPFMEEDSLLYSFSEDDECQDEFSRSTDKEELMKKLGNFEKIRIDYGTIEQHASDFVNPLENGINEIEDEHNNSLGNEIPLEKVIVNGGDRTYMVSSEGKPNDMHFIVSPAKAIENKIINTNKNYFGSYGSFGIHREMISDKVRTDAYRRSIIDNPSLLNGAVVLDVGCGTGILSLFAAQAGASRVIAVEASDKMAAVATQIAKDNGLLSNGSSKEENNGVIEVVHGMVEELVESRRIEPRSVDVLVSEWMGYCLLYESMLSSVLIARDQWLKPGGAILPDTATMFVAGFGRGATSIPFWEDVYGFSMSCVGKELVEDAAQGPIVDVVDGNDIVTNTAILKTFDLATMKPDEVEFTATIELEMKLGDDPADSTPGSESKKKKNWCYGLVLWFDTCFTSRFCKDTPTVLSTSPYTPKTHWSQTILTLREPIALGKADFEKCGGGVVGTDECPASRMESRISIARAPQHRSIDISMEVAVVAVDGRRRKWPIQMFNLY